MKTFFEFILEAEMGSPMGGPGGGPMGGPGGAEGLGSPGGPPGGMPPMGGGMPPMSGGPGGPPGGGMPGMPGMPGAPPGGQPATVQLEPRSVWELWAKMFKDGDEKTTKKSSEQPEPKQKNLMSAPI